VRVCEARKANRATSQLLMLPARATPRKQQQKKPRQQQQLLLQQIVTPPGGRLTIDE